MGNFGDLIMGNFGDLIMGNFQNPYRHFPKFPLTYSIVCNETDQCDNLNYN